MALNNYPHVYEPIRVGRSHAEKQNPVFADRLKPRRIPVWKRSQASFWNLSGAQAKNGAPASLPSDQRQSTSRRAVISTDAFPPPLTTTWPVSGPWYAKCTDTAACYRSSSIMAASGEPIRFRRANGAWVPSVVAPYHDPKRFREINRTDMLSVIDDFVAVTKRLVKSHFDMIMIHYAPCEPHVGLPVHRLEPAHRPVRVVSEKNRWRFPLELLEAVYSVTKGDVPLEMPHRRRRAYPGRHAA